MGEVYIASLSYGKDSIAMLEAIKQLGWPLDRIVHAEIWATDEISADLPPMVEFKTKADKIIEERYGITVEHICAMCTPDRKYPFVTPPLVGGWTKLTYNDLFYTKSARGKWVGNIYGFPKITAGWCKKLKYEDRAIDIPRYILSHPQPKEEDRRISEAWGVRSELSTQERGDAWDSLKSREIGVQATSKTAFSSKTLQQGSKNKDTVVQYLGLAMDEPERVARYQERKGFKLPLVEIGWDEAFCRKWCEENDLLSPIYTTATRGGCWFCHNQSIGQLRLLRKNYPDLWALLMKWDLDSPVTFKADGHTVHDFDRRFQLEDEGFIDPKGRFHWKDLDDPKRQLSFFDMLEE